VVWRSPGIDASRASSLTLDWLDEHGYHDLVSDAVVVINQVRGNGGRELKQVVEPFHQALPAVSWCPGTPPSEGLRWSRRPAPADPRPPTSTRSRTTVAAAEIQERGALRGRGDALEEDGGARVEAGEAEDAPIGAQLNALVGRRTVRLRGRVATAGSALK